MDPKTDGSGSSSGTRLGSIEVTLFLDPGTSAHATQTKLLSSEKVAPEAALVIGALLFAQRQMRAISDPARVAATTEMAAASAAARQLSSQLSPPSRAGRSSATYRIDLITNGSFRIDVDQRMDGLLNDVAGGLTAGAIAGELLATLSAPYRAFYREMLDAATGYWRDRRPSAIESTWDWGVALRRMRYLVVQGGTAAAEPVSCESCQSLRPSGSPCLRCGASGGMARPTVEAPIAYAPPAYPPSPPVAPPSTPAPETPRPVAPAVTMSVAAPAATRPEAEHTILRASEPPTIQLEEAKKDDDAWPLASFPRRLGALVFDLVTGIALGLIGAAGLTAILIASGGFAPGDSPSTFMTGAVAVILGLYLLLGWIKGETVGMLVFRLRILSAADRRPIGLIRSFRRAFGTALLLAVGFGVFGILWTLDNQATFIQGAADMAIRVIAGIIGLYIIWMGSAQPILGKVWRQTWGDRIAGTVVAVRQR